MGHSAKSVPKGTGCCRRRRPCTSPRHLPTPLEADVLLRDLASLVKQDRVSTAMILAHLAEVEARRLYRSAGYSSMFAYCLGALGMSEDAAGKRIQAARAARRFPILFHAVADGRLHLTAVDMLAPHLTAESVEEWVAAASYKTKAQI